MHRLILSLLVFTGPALGELLPSEATTLIRAEMRLHPDRQRSEQTAPYADRVITENLSRAERFALGEFHFLDFDPEAARDAFWEFRDDPGLLGRVAWQRLLQIRFAAFGMREEVEAELDEYRRRFPPDPRDRFDLMQALSNLCGHHLGEGQPQRAVALIDAELERLDLRAPYWAYALPALFLSAYDAVDRVDEARRIVGRIIADLRGEAARRQAATPAVDSLARGIMFGHEPRVIAGEYFFTALSDGADYHEQTARYLRLADFIEGKLQGAANP